MKQKDLLHLLTLVMFIHLSLWIMWVFSNTLYHCCLPVHLFMLCHNSGCYYINVLLSRLLEIRVTDSCQQIRSALWSGEQQRKRAQENKTLETQREQTCACLLKSYWGGLYSLCLLCSPEMIKSCKSYWKILNPCIASGVVASLVRIRTWVRQLKIYSHNHLSFIPEV